MRVCLKEENDEIPSVPPGFESFATFTLKKVHDDEKQKSEDVISRSASPSTSEIQSVKMETESDSCADAKKTRPRRACISYGQCENNAGDEFDSEKLKQVSF